MIFVWKWVRLRIEFSGYRHYVKQSDFELLFGKMKMEYAIHVIR